MASGDGMIAAKYAATILHSAPDAVVLADANGTVRSWNVGAEELFGYTTADAVGSSLTTLIVPKRHQEKHDAGYAAVMNGGASKYGRRDYLRVPAVKKDGSKIAIEFSLQTLTNDDGKPVASLAMMRDASQSSNTIRKLRARIAELEKAL